MLPTLDPKSVQCVVTSPPYYGLRKYPGPASRFNDGWEGQLGHEPTPLIFVDHLLEVIDGIERVLSDDGIFWLNIMDSYSGSGRNHGSIKEGTIQRGHARATSNLTPERSGTVPRKSVMLIPERVILAMSERGWIIRRTIVWHKPSPMTEGMKDRPTRPVLLQAVGRKEQESRRKPLGRSSALGVPLVKRDLRLALKDVGVVLISVAMLWDGYWFATRLFTDASWLNIFTIAMNIWAGIILRNYIHKEVDNDRKQD